MVPRRQPSPEQLRAIRSLELLERWGEVELLQVLASQGADTWVGRQAQIILDRVVKVMK